jgi:hypothetical protein
LDFDDIAGFVELLGASGLHTVTIPEPTSIRLMVLGLAVALVFNARRQV